MATGSDIVVMTPLLSRPSAGAVIGALFTVTLVLFVLGLLGFAGL